MIYLTAVGGWLGRPLIIYTIQTAARPCNFSYRNIIPQKTPHCKTFIAENVNILCLLSECHHNKHDDIEYGEARTCYGRNGYEHPVLSFMESSPESQCLHEAQRGYPHGYGEYCQCQCCHIAECKACSGVWADAADAAIN